MLLTNISFKNFYTSIIIFLSLFNILNYLKAQENYINLLELDKTSIHHLNIFTQNSAELKNLSDKDLSSCFSLTLATKQQSEIIYEFDGETVSPVKVNVTLSVENESDNNIGEIEILVSTMSPNAGFQHVITGTLKNINSLQTFVFKERAAKWIMLRLKSVEKEFQLSIAEVNISGYKGSPKSHYEFKETPVSTIEILNKLNEVLKSVYITPDEKNLFFDASDGRLDRWSIAEASLISSGITDKTKREEYLSNIDILKNKAKEALNNATTPFEKAEALLIWMHKNVLSSGYSSSQTNLSKLLDEGKFNCVSSAVLFNILGKEVGLDIKAVEVPDHVFLILYDGNTHVDIETTTPYGFNPKTDHKVLDNIKKITGFSYVSDSLIEKRREVEEIGLTALIYYNQGVLFNEQKKYEEALFSYYCALSFDPVFPSAIHNVLYTLTNWSVELAQKKQFKESLKLVEIGLVLVPLDVTFRSNYQAIVNQWAEYVADSGDLNRAVQIYRDASTVFPEGNFNAMQAGVYIRLANNSMQSKQWSEAIEIVESGKKNIDEAAVKELENWQKGIYFEWLNNELENKQFKNAIAIIENANKVFPEEYRFKYNLGYIAQELVKEISINQGQEKADEFILDFIKRFADIKDILDVFKNYYLNQIKMLLFQNIENSETQISGYIKSFYKIFKNTKLVDDLVRYGYDNQAQKMICNQEWVKAIEIYETALKILPNDSILKNNLEYCKQKNKTK